MIDINKIKNDFFKKYELEKLVEYCKDKNPEDIETDDFKQLPNFYTGLNYSFKCLIEDTKINWYHTFNNEKMLFTFCFDENKDVHIKMFKAFYLVKEEDFFIDFAIYKKDNKEYLRFTFIVDEDFNNKAELKIDSNNHYTVNQSSYSDVYNETKTMIESIINFNNKDLRSDLINYIIYGKHIQLNQEFLDTYTLLHDDKFDQDYFNRWKINTSTLNKKKINSKIP